MKQKFSLGKKNTIFDVPILSALGSFFIAFIEYCVHKFDSFIFYLHYFVIKYLEFFVNFKFKAAAALFRSRGQLVKRYRYALMVFLILFVYLGVGVYQGRFVKEQEQSTVRFLSSNNIFYDTSKAATDSSDIKLRDAPIEHEVKVGETLVTIAKDYKISLEYIKFANDLVDNSVRAGQILKIPPVEGTIHRVEKGDTIDKIAKKYNVPSQSILDFNYIDSAFVLSEGVYIIVPEAQIPTEQRYYAGAVVYDTSAYGLIPYAGNLKEHGSGQFVWPFSGIITQTFTRYHPALDIAARTGDIFSVDKGKVIRAGWWQGGYGNAVQVDHGNGYVTTYAHMSVISVSTGDNVDRGQKIGVVGNTGNVRGITGIHLHFTVQEGGRYIDPMSILP